MGRILKQTPIWFIILLSLAGYLLVGFWFPLTPYFDRYPQLDVRSFSPSLVDGLTYGLLLCFLYGLYGLAAYRTRQLARPPRLGLILLTAVLFCLPLLQTYPINATDIYRYFIRGRVMSVYGENSLAVAPDQFAHDPYLPLAGEWQNQTSPYGPLWETIAAGITRVAQDDLHLGLLLFKSVGLLSHLAIATLIWSFPNKNPISSPRTEPSQHNLQPPIRQPLVRNSQSQRATYTLLWAWNPALLLMFVVDGHNDVFMLFWLVLGTWVIARGRPTAGFLIMLFGPLAKPIGLLPLPGFWLAALRQRPSTKARIRFLLLTGIGSLLLLGIAFLPFGSPFDLAVRLLNESSFGGFSLTTLVILAGRRIGFGLAANPVTRLAQILFLGFALWLWWRIWHGRSAVRSAADMFFGYIYTAFSFRIWYTTWPFPWLILDGKNEAGDGRVAYRLRYGFWLLLTAQLSVIIYGHIRVYLLSGDQTAAHLIGVPFTFLLPFFLAQFAIDGKSAGSSDPPTEK